LIFAPLGQQIIKIPTKRDGEEKTGLATAAYHVESYPTERSSRLFAIWLVDEDL
jgi:hypothetical protein